MEKFLKTVDRISELSGKGVSFLVIPLVVVILYEIFARYIFQSPTIWVHETAQMIYGAYVILLGAYVLRRNGHVNVEILYGRFAPRTRAAIDLFTCGEEVDPWKAYLYLKDSLRAAHVSTMEMKRGQLEFLEVEGCGAVSHKYQAQAGAAG